MRLPPITKTEAALRHAQMRLSCPCRSLVFLIAFGRVLLRLNYVRAKRPGTDPKLPVLRRHNESCQNHSQARRAPKAQDLSVRQTAMMSLRLRMTNRRSTTAVTEHRRLFWRDQTNGDEDGEGCCNGCEHAFPPAVRTVPPNKRSNWNRRSNLHRCASSAAIATADRFKFDQSRTRPILFS